MKVEYFSLPELRGLAQHSQSIGWYSEADWELFLRTGVVLGHRLKTGEIVSSAYVSNFESRAGSLGAFIVNQRFQGKKLGKALIEKAVSLIPQSDFVLSLVATQRGKQMYEQAGFIEVGNTHKYVLKSAVGAVAHSSIRNFQESDWPVILKLDRHAIGYGREKLLRHKIEHALKVYVFDEDGVLGFIMVGKDGEKLILGPLVASSLPIARALLVSSLEFGKSYRIDIPHWQGDLIRAVADLHFELERICPWMTYRGQPLTVTSDSYYALMSQALG